MIWVQLHDCEQCPLDRGEVAFLHRDAAVETFLRAKLQDDLDELLVGWWLKTDSILDSTHV